MDAQLWLQEQDLIYFSRISRDEGHKCEDLEPYITGEIRKKKAAHKRKKKMRANTSLHIISSAGAVGNTAYEQYSMLLP